MLKEKGYRVQTNSTIFRETSADEIEELVRFLSGLNVDGMLVTPGYHYQVLTTTYISRTMRCRSSFNACVNLPRITNHQYADLPRLSGR